MIVLGIYFLPWGGKDSRITAAVLKMKEDSELRNKAVKLVDEWAKTLPANGDLNMHHYPWEKLLGGLSDMKQYAGYDKADSLMEKITDWAIDNLDRTRTPAAICFGSILSLTPNWKGERFDDGRPKVDWMLDLTVHGSIIFPIKNTN